MAEAVIGWMYTDELELDSKDMDFVLDLMRAAHTYDLHTVKQR